MFQSSYTINTKYFFTKKICPKCGSKMKRFWGEIPFSEEERQFREQRARRHGKFGGELDGFNATMHLKCVNCHFEIEFDKYLVARTIQKKEKRKILSDIEMSAVQEWEGSYAFIPFRFLFICQIFLMSLTVFTLILLNIKSFLNINILLIGIGFILFQLLFLFFTRFVRINPSIIFNSKGIKIRSIKKRKYNWSDIVFAKTISVKLNLIKISFSDNSSITFRNNYFIKANFARFCKNDDVLKMYENVSLV